MDCYRSCDLASRGSCSEVVGQNSVVIQDLATVCLYSLSLNELMALNIRWAKESRKDITNGLYLCHREKSWLTVNGNLGVPKQ